MRIVIPPLTSQYLNLTKNSSLAIAIGYPDLTATAGTVLNQTGQAIEGVLIMMVVYLIISLVTSAVMNVVQRQNGAGGEVRPCRNMILPGCGPKWHWRNRRRPACEASCAWVRKNLVGSVGDVILTVLGIALVVMILPPIINWAFISAQWAGPDRTVCATVAQGGIQPDGWSGACWAFVNAKFGQFMFGRYPIEERWRPILVAILFVALLVPLLMPRVPRKGLNAILLFLVLPIVAFVLLVGGMFGLPHVETPLWGGLLVTLSLSFVGIAVSLPLGIVLALGRRSKMPIVKMLCVVFIESCAAFR